MNPYDFVRIDWDRGVKRRPALPHDHFEGLCGRIEGTITTLTPCFIPAPGGVTIQRPFQDPYHPFFSRKGATIIPGSSLKGLIRNLVETIGYGCWCFPESVHISDIEDDFHPCTGDKLCVACRMFGTTNTDGPIKGQVSFEDAICEDPGYCEKMYTPDLMAPKPDQAPWYLDHSGESTRVAGRKFYFHSREIWQDDEFHTTQSGIRLNSYIEPVDRGNVFEFAVDFDSLAADELSLLLYSLTLEDHMRHKVGYAKPAGLGSVEVRIQSLTLIDYADRYGSSVGGDSTYTGESLQAYLRDQTAACRGDESPTLRDLRRIWKWKPDETPRGYAAWELRCDLHPVDGLAQEA
jgi:hypothetical protein